MIQVIHGSIFDTKCDLLVVPCDDMGGVTYSVMTNLINSGLPTNVGRIAYGKVHFLESNYEFANTVGYAASVDASKITSEPEKIISVAQEIVQYAKLNQIKLVNVPLLGSGAGGLSPIQSFEALQSVFQTYEDIKFNIFCFTKDQFRNITSSTDFDKLNQQKVETPRVFISYTGNDKSNASWVKHFTDKLRKNGVNARLDIYHLKPGNDLPQWMTNEVIMSDKVLLICDKHYMEKADFRTGGVGWETMIIQGDMLAQGDNKQKYIAIIREEKPEEALPIYMKSKYAFHWGKSKEIDEEKFKELILRIFDCDLEPELGEIPEYILQKNSV